MVVFCFFKQKTAYEMRISDWSSDVCSSDLLGELGESPESASNQQAVVTSAESLIQVFQRTDAAIRQAREDADAQIAESVASVNSALEQIDVLNKEISTRGNVGADFNDLKDKRDNLIDQIEREIPIRTITQSDRSEERRVGKECVRKSK